MEITPIAYESLGTRGSSVFVRTGDLAILIDPGVDLAPMRFRLPPHRIELERKAQHWERIRELARGAEVLIVTHYHHDHFHEHESDLFRGKTVLLKHPSENINFRQKMRARALLERIRDTAREIHYADGRDFTFGAVRIRFSQAVCHGIDTRSGYVVEVSLRGDTGFLHTSDVGGPILPEQLEFILNENPEVLFCDGPVSSMAGSRYDRDYLRRSIDNLITIIRRTGVRRLILDHHLLREMGWRERISPVFEAARSEGVRLSTAAEFAGLKTDLLEAKRKELYENRPDQGPHRHKRF
ncbi:MAG: MBL fold metallo-hydrolase [bacterium]